jgi:hypothetical protein
LLDIINNDWFLELGLNGIFLGCFILGYTFGYIMIQMDVRIQQISQICTDFFYFLLETKHWDLKKSVPIREIR